MSTWHNGKGVADANAEDGRKNVGKLHCDGLVDWFVGFIVRNSDGYYVDGRPKDSLVFIGQSGLIVADDGSSLRNSAERGCWQVPAYVF